MQYILVRHGKKPELVELDRSTSAGNIRVHGYPKVLRRTTSGSWETTGNSYKKDRDYVYEHIGDNLIVLAKNYEVNQAKIKKDIAERKAFRAKVDAKLAEQLTIAKERLSEDFAKLKDSAIKHITDDPYQDGETVETLIFHGQIAVDPKGRQKFNHVSILAKKEQDDRNWRLSYTYYTDRCTGASSSISNETLDDGLWDIVRDVYFS